MIARNRNDSPMTIPSPGKRPSAARRYGLAVLLAVLALAGSAVPGLKGPGTPVLLGLFGIVLAARFGGRGPGLVATLLFAALTLPPEWEVWRVVRHGLFVAAG